MAAFLISRKTAWQIIQSTASLRSPYQKTLTQSPDSYLQLVGERSYIGMQIHPRCSLRYRLDHAVRGLTNLALFGKKVVLLIKQAYIFVEQNKQDAAHPQSSVLWEEQLWQKDLVSYYMVHYIRVGPSICVSTQAIRNIQQVSDFQPTLT